jgi:hypothetical protein
MSAEALSNKQFNTEQSMLRQGNDDEMMNRVRGIQNMTSNIFRPSFSQDFSAVHAMPSGTQFRSSMPHSAAGAEQEDDEMG